MKTHGAPAPSKREAVWVAQATDKAAKHHRNTTGTRQEHDPHQNFLILVVGATFERDRAMCFQVVEVWLLSSQCGCVV